MTPTKLKALRRKIMNNRYRVLVEHYGQMEIASWGNSLARALFVAKELSKVFTHVCVQDVETDELIGLEVAA